MHEIFLDQMTSFEVFKSSPKLTLFIKCLWLRPSAYPSGLKLINGIISKTAHRIFFLFSLLIYFFKHETIAGSRAWTFVIQSQIQAVWFFIITRISTQNSNLELTLKCIVQCGQKFFAQKDTMNLQSHVGSLLQAAHIWPFMCHILFLQRAFGFFPKCQKKCNLSKFSVKNSPFVILYRA